MRKFFALALLTALLLPACALALTGQPYDTFAAYYKEDVSFINENDNRHLLPMVLSQRNGGGDDTHAYYDLYGDVLTVSVTADISGIVESCEISLTAPDNMAYGDSTYNDFAISGYHSYAFLMAMATEADPASRYALVTDVVEGMRAGDGQYTKQIGAYTLTCSRDGSTAVLSFVNNALQTDAPAADPEATTSPSPTDDGDDIADDEYIG